MIKKMLSVIATAIVIAVFIGAILVLRWGFITDCPNTGIYVYCEPKN